jgi:DNA-binding NtrC family response regulator
MNEKILVVDDDDLVLECYERVLSHQFTLDTAPGPWEALHALSTRGPYAVVVSDMRMPKMNGIQFLTKAKELVPDIVGILLSGNFGSDEADSIPKDLVFKVLEKPLPFNQLIGFVREALAYHHDHSREACI